ncbi:MAG: hypothetical protein M9899_00375 [Bdellovibrionaceae bacterium]|nr:hypothetical protein [Pseudobdellovibrionaceae bacterium]
MTKWLVLLSVLFSASVTYANRFEYLKHVDVRDIAKYDKSAVHFRGTSSKILEMFEAHPGLFVGPTADDLIIPEMNTRIKFYRDGAVGPDGHYKTNESGQEVFVATKKNEHTRRNAILSVDYENVVDVTGEDKVFDADLLLFIHDENIGYYFRRLQVRVDWHQNAGGKGSIFDVVQVQKFYEDIHLNETKFSVNVSILDRKMILEDSYYLITKVFPLTVGALDIRTQTGMDGQVHSMTFLVPSRMRNSTNKYEEYEDFKNAEIKKASQWHAINNTRARNFPAYFRGRPFIAVIDKNLGENAGGYREVGFHYQITRDKLVRGFESHGCMRMADKDLYQLDAILNEGPHNTLSTKAVYNLPQYKWIDNPMPKVNSNYNVVAYSKADPQTRNVRCENGTSYAVRRYGVYHTVSDGDCLTLIQRRNKSVQPVIDYIAGLGRDFPETYVASNLTHIPLKPKVVEKPPVVIDPYYDQRNGNYQNGQYFPPRPIPVDPAPKKKKTLFDFIFGG